MAASGIPKNSVTATNPIKLPSMVRSFCKANVKALLSLPVDTHAVSRKFPGLRVRSKTLTKTSGWRGSVADAKPQLGGGFFGNARELTSSRNRSAPWSRARGPLAVCDCVWAGSAWKRLRRRCGKRRKEWVHRRARRGRRRRQTAGVESVGPRASRTGQAGDGWGRTVPVRVRLRGGREHLRRAPRRKLRALQYRKSGCHN